MTREDFEREISELLADIAQFRGETPPPCCARCDELSDAEAAAWDTYTAWNGAGK